MFVYLFYVMGFMIWNTYKRSRYEFLRHRLWFVIVFLILLVTVPLDV